MAQNKSYVTVQKQGGRLELRPPVESSDFYYEKVLTTTPVRDTCLLVIWFES
jgi:hypothetical protein